MSKIAFKPNESGTGTFEIQAPATNTNRVLELPDEAGKVLTDVSDIEPQVKTATNASGAAPIYACRAWVNFNGNNGSIRASGNVSSVVRTGTGAHTVNFSTAMPDSNYCANISGGDDLVSTGRVFNAPDGTSALSVNSFRIRTRNLTGNDVDSLFLLATFFR